MKKIAFILFIIMAIMISAVSCSGSFDTIKVMALKGPTGMGMAKIINDNTSSVYDITIAGAPDEITAEIIKGTYDIAAVPTNLAPILYEKTNGALYIAAVNTGGVLYVLENGDTIQSINDLEGKKIYATGQGSTPEYILSYILEANNINAEVEYLTEHSELATLMTSGDVVLGMLPEPNVTSVLKGNTDVRIALNLTEEFNKIAGDSAALYQGCIVVNKDFADNHRDELDKFLTEYKASVEFVNSNISEAAKMIETAGIIPKAPVAEAAIPNCNIMYLDGSEMQTKLNGFFEVLFAANPASIGGEMPSADIYLK